jgi:enoyl-CoA hydratase
LARSIVANGPLSVAASKRIMRDQAGWAADELWARQNDIVMPVFASNDAREGASAFAEKRAPVWSGT